MVLFVVQSRRPLYSEKLCACLQLLQVSYNFVYIYVQMYPLNLVLNWHR